MSGIGVVVVAHESDDVLPGLLTSLAEHEPDAQVVVVDDASPSGPPDVGAVELVRSSENRGYAASANRGAAALGRFEPDCLVFLNPDVRLQGPSLTELAAGIARRPKVGVAAGPLQGPDGIRMPSAWGPTSVRRAMVFAAGIEPVRLRSAAGASLRQRMSMSAASRVHDDVRIEGHVMGGTMMVRTACFEEIGGFDEEFFLYWEDADLCHRARDSGWEVRMLPAAPLRLARPPAGPADDQRWQLFVDGAQRFGRKHLIPGQAKQLEAALALGRRVGRLRERG